MNLRSILILGLISGIGGGIISFAWNLSEDAYKDLYESFEIKLQSIKNGDTDDKVRSRLGEPTTGHEFSNQKKAELNELVSHGKSIEMKWEYKVHNRKYHIIFTDRPFHGADYDWRVKRIFERR